MKMKFFLAAAMLMLTAVKRSWASGDFDCFPEWTLHRHSYTRCSNLPMLAPGNDSMTNLKLLLAKGNLKFIPTDNWMASYGYGTVPFRNDSLTEQIIIAEIGQPDRAKEEVEYFREGTRCSSNATGNAAFIAALNTGGWLPASEKQLLAEAREKFVPICADRSDSSDTVSKAGQLNIDATQIVSPRGREFLGYLTAAAAFYQGSYNEALFLFRSLAQNSQNPWLRETATYMQARTELNRAQKDAFDEYGFHDLSKVDINVVHTAEILFDEYLKIYPEGIYAASARGLLRRTYWLAGKMQKLANEYSSLISNTDNNICSLNNLVQEIDNKMLATIKPEQVSNPLLLAELDLMLMRPAHEVGNEKAVPSLSFADLQKQEPVFAKQKELYQYLLAAHYFYLQKKPALALQVLPESLPSVMTYAAFSGFMLRGLALEAEKNYAAARQLWLKLLPAATEPLQSETVQLALAMNYEQSNETAAVFTDKSPITDVAIRNRLLRKVASASLLRQVIASSTSPQERHVALYTLLYKDLLQGQYKDYQQDHSLLTKEALSTDLPADCDENCLPFLGINNYEDNGLRLKLFTWSGKENQQGLNCPTTAEIAAMLAKNPHDSYGLLCLGDFIAFNELDNALMSQQVAPDEEDKEDSIILGGSASAFPGALFSRGEAYQRVIGDKKASPEQKAYALHRAVKCYAPSGYNHCGGKDFDVSVRKSWFRLLKKDYSQSIWAQKLKYYW